MAEESHFALTSPYIFWLLVLVAPHQIGIKHGVLTTAFHSLLSCNLCLDLYGSVKKLAQYQHIYMFFNLYPKDGSEQN